MWDYKENITVSHCRCLSVFRCLRHTQRSHNFYSSIHVAFMFFAFFIICSQVFITVALSGMPCQSNQCYDVSPVCPFHEIRCLYQFILNLSENKAEYIQYENVKTLTWGSALAQWFALWHHRRSLELMSHHW